MNDRLYELIKELQDNPRIANRCDTSDITTVGGYQPDLILHEAMSDHPVWKQFAAEIIHPAIQRYMAMHQKIAGWPVKGSSYHFDASWAVLYPAGAYQAPHLHRNISCVVTYYPCVPVRPEPEGALSFINPHAESTFPVKKGWRYDHTVYPRTGSCIVFPGWLQHYSHPHQAEQERLLFSTDVRFEPPAD